MSELSDAIAFVRAELAKADAAIGPNDYSSAWFERQRLEMEALAARLVERFPARITTRWDGARVRICGVTSTATSGLRVAFGNWLAAAKRANP